MKRRWIKGTIAWTGAVLLCFVLACRASGSVADFYASRMYPGISSFLSRVSSLVPFSLQEFIGLAASALFVLLLAGAIFRRIEWKRFAVDSLLLVLWLFVWSYVGWACNYYRSSIFERSGCPRAAFDKDRFMSFLDEYTLELDDSWCPDEFRDTMSLEREVHEWYSKVDKDFALAAPKDWQHPKTSWFSRGWRGAGVTGFIGPMTGEHHVMKGLPSLEYPFTYAHELSHVLGVSSEAEANWWAYKACRASSDPAVRYSASFFVLGYVASNARAVLSKEEYSQWISTVRPEVLDDSRKVHEFWVSQRLDLFDRFQSWLYNIFLKSNRVGSGIASYSEIVSLLVSLDREPVSIKQL